jgi:outer membrane lipoprotein-sorting protein
MITSIKRFSIAAFLIIINLTVSAQEDAKKIYTRATDQILVENMQIQMELEITDKKGRVKEKEFEVLVAKFGDTSKTKMSWEKPEEAKGTTVILTEIPNETGLIEVFTPSNGKVRKLKATSDNLALVGSELSMTNLPDQSPDELSFKLLDSEEVDGKSCYHLEIMAENATDAAKGEILVEKQTYRILQVTVYDSNGVKTSQVKLSNYQPIDGVTKKVQAMLIVTEDFTSHKQTEMRVLKITSRTDFKEEDFQLPMERDI